MLNDPTDLRIPGPTPVPPRVLEAMAQPMIPHRGKLFSTFYRELIDQLRRLHKTSHDVFVIAGTGSAGWEASIVNTLQPGDPVLALVNGSFGDRWIGAAEAFGIKVIRLDTEWGNAFHADEVRQALKDNPEVRAVFLTHNETSTGVLNPVQEIGEVVREHGALLFLDSVSGIGGVPLEMDAWNCDIVFSGSQKAFMCPPGLSIVAVNDRVYEAAARASIPRYTFDFKRMKEAQEQGSTPSTAAIGLMYGLKEACDMIEEEGLENVIQRHVEQGEYVRRELDRLRMKCIAEAGYESPTVTAAWTPEGITSGQIVNAMIERHGIHIAQSQGKITDTVIRIGHMGWSDYPELERTIKALDDVLEHIPVTQSATA